MSYLFSSESVTKGHPDKMADYIADSILDALLSIDPQTKSAVEVSLSASTVFIFGEVTSKAVVNYVEIAKNAIRNIGYDNPIFQYDPDNLEYIIRLNTQSPDIALGLIEDMENGKEQGAGDQGLMFGFAKDDTPNLMPLPIDIAHKLSLRLSYVRETNIIEGLGPDGKTQVTVKYDNMHNPICVDTIIISTQHHENKNQNQLKEELIRYVINHVIDEKYMTNETKIFINPTGRFVIGGPVGDSGLTGRKIIVDTYGGYSRHGGGAFSGKDSSKVDRSASYMARYIAKQIVASKVAKTCEIQIAYAIGVAKPVSVYVNTFNTSKVSDEIILDAILNNFDLRPKAIVNKLNLKAAIFKHTVNGGHFGREYNEFAWEKTDKKEIFEELLNNKQ